MPLTQDEALATIAEMTPAQIEALPAIPGRAWDLLSRGERLAVAAALDAGRRAEQARAEAVARAALERDKAQARAVWEQAGSPGSFDSFFAEHQRERAHEQLEAQRRASRYRMAF